jgi:DUF4097 and DUF4098 domain-containing protein YvlB
MSGRTIRVAAIGVATGAILAGTLVAQSRKEYRFNVTAKAGVSVNNPFGSISVKPSSGYIVVISAMLYSTKVEVDNGQSGNRVEIQSHLLPGADAESGRVDYEILVPADASITLRTSTGPLHVERMHGDMTLESNDAPVDVRDVSNAHVHVKTLNGPVTVTNVQQGHVEVDSLSGEVTLERVSGPLVQVISTSGKINYSGDFGGVGEYRLTSHSGDIEAVVPESTSADVSVHSVKGEVHDEIPLHPKQHTAYPTDKANAFVGTMGQPALSSTVVLRSFSGKIQLRKRSAK